MPRKRLKTSSLGIYRQILCPLAGHRDLGAAQGGAFKHTLCVQFFAYACRRIELPLKLEQRPMPTGHSTDVADPTFKVTQG
jgi:hypothetical protein